MENRDFLGIGWEFPPAFDKGGVRMVAMEVDIKQSLAVLFSTVKGERIFRPEYGTEIRRWTFANINLSEETLIKDAIAKAISVGEPRITLMTVEIEVKDALEGELWIHLNYLINAINSSDNLVFPIYVSDDPK